VVLECGRALSREQEDALWLQVLTAQPARHGEFEPSSKRRKKRPVAWPPATAWTWRRSPRSCAAGIEAVPWHAVDTARRAAPAPPIARPSGLSRPLQSQKNTQLRQRLSR